MGLDITAYRQLKAAPEAELDSEGSPVQWDRYAYIQSGRIEGTEKTWPGRTAPVKPGVYSAAEQMGFRAGSYSGYNQWREWLAKAAGWPSAAVVWDHAKSGPFYELIDFTDCEGVIGSVVAAKLAADFAQHEAEIIAKADDWQARLYREWRKAFEMAADGGCVEFH